MEWQLLCKRLRGSWTCTLRKQIQRNEQTNRSKGTPQSHVHKAVLRQGNGMTNRQIDLGIPTLYHLTHCRDPLNWSIH